MIVVSEIGKVKSDIDLLDGNSILCYLLCYCLGRRIVIS